MVAGGQSDSRQVASKSNCDSGPPILGSLKNAADVTSAGIRTADLGRIVRVAQAFVCKKMAGRMPPRSPSAKLG